MNVLCVSFLLLIILLTLFAGGCSQQPSAQGDANSDVEYTLTTAMDAGRMVFKGVGGEIDGVTNPDLTALQGETVRITLINGDDMPHDLAIPEVNAATSVISAKGQSTEVTFGVTSVGKFSYFCTVSGHRQVGMEGALVVGEP